MAGLFVPQMVAPVNTSGLADIGRTIGGLQEDAGIADIMKGLDPNDPNSFARTMTKLSAYGGPTARDMVDRMTGVWNTREQVGYNRQEVAKEEARQTAFEQRATDFAKRNQIPGMGGASGDGVIPVPQSAAPARPSNEPSVAPAPQRVGGPVMPTNRVWGDAEAEAAGLYEPTTKPAAAPVLAGPGAPAPGVRVAGGPLGGVPPQQLPPPPPRNAAGTGAVPSPLPPAPLGPSPAVAPVMAAAGPAPTPVAGPAPVARPPVGIADLVSAQAPQVPAPATLPDARTLVQQINELSAMRPRTAAQQKFIDAQVKIRQDQLDKIQGHQNESFKAQVKAREGVLSKDAEHAFKINDKIIDQMGSDNSSLRSLTRAEQLLNEGLITGDLQRGVEWTAKKADAAGTLLESLGLPRGSFPGVTRARNAVAAMEEFHGIAAKTLFDILGGFGRNISDADRKTMDAIVGGLPKTFDGNMRLIQYAKGIISERRESGRAVQAYMNQVRTTPGATPSAAHIAEIQARYADRAIELVTVGGKVPVTRYDPTTGSTATPGAPAVRQTPAPAARGGPAVKAITQDEYNRLPSGATYTAPDGTQRTKGGT